MQVSLDVAADAGFLFRKAIAVVNTLRDTPL